MPPFSKAISLESSCAKFASWVVQISVLPSACGCLNRVRIRFPIRRIKLEVGSSRAAGSRFLSNRSGDEEELLLTPEKRSDAAVFKTADLRQRFVGDQAVGACGRAHRRKIWSPAGVIEEGVGERELLLLRTRAMSR